MADRELRFISQWSTSITREAYMKLKAKDQASATKAHFTTAQIPYSVADFRRERKRDEKPGISPSPTCIRHLFEKHAKEKYDE